MRSQGNVAWRWIKASAGVAILLAIGLGLYSGSGLPMPFSRPTQSFYERFRYAYFSRLAERIAEVRRENPGLKITGQEMRKALHDLGLLTEGDKAPAVVGGIVFTAPMAEIGSPCLIGEDADAVGMIWAVTDRGFVIKVPADEWTARAVPTSGTAE